MWVCAMYMQFILQTVSYIRTYVHVHVRRYNGCAMVHAFRRSSGVDPLSMTITFRHVHVHARTYGDSRLGAKTKDFLVNTTYKPHYQKINK